MPSASKAASAAPEETRLEDVLTLDAAESASPSDPPRPPGLAPPPPRPGFLDSLASPDSMEGTQLEVQDLCAAVGLPAAPEASSLDSGVSTHAAPSGALLAESATKPPPPPIAKGTAGWVQDTIPGQVGDSDRAAPPGPIEKNTQIVTAGKFADNGRIVDDAENRKIFSSLLGWVKTTAALERTDSRPVFFDWKEKLVNPRHPWMTAWDIQTTALLLYTATVTPFEVAFLGGSFKLNGMFFTNAYVDLCFVADIVLQFFVPFQDENSGSLVRKHRLIAAKYLQGWFFIDLISVFPFDLVPLMTGGEHEDLRVLRVMRLLKLAKLLRVVRLARMFKRWEARLFINYAVLNMWGFFVLLIIGAHWLACLWGFLVDFDADASFGQSFPLTNDDCEPFDCYQACMYWSVGMITAMGDVASVNIYNKLQRGIYIIVMCIAGVANAYLIGGVVAILERMNEQKSEFYRDMDILNGFLHARRIMEGHAVVDGTEVAGHTICEKLRTYYIFKHSQGSLMENFQKILYSCSQQMQSAVAGKMHAESLTSIPFFKNASDKFITMLSTQTETRICAAHEVVFDVNDESDALYIIEHGTVFCKGRIKRKTDTFGEEVFYQEGRRRYIAQTLSEVVLVSIHRDVLRAAVEATGDHMMKVRMKCISAVIKVQKVTRRATVLAMNRRNFHSGYEILQKEYPDEVLETMDCPIIRLWEWKVMECIASIIFVTAAPLGPGENSVQLQRLQELKASAARYFSSQAKRVATKEEHRLANPVDRFLTREEHFAGHNMEHCRLQLAANQCTLRSVAQCSVSELMLMGIVYPDAVRIKAGLRLALASLRAGSASKASIDPSIAEELEKIIAQEDEDSFAGLPRTSAGPPSVQSRPREEGALRSREPASRSRDFEAAGQADMREAQTEMEVFLKDHRRFGGADMSHHVVRLTENGLSLRLLRSCRTADLVLIGLPLGDAVQIVQACSAHGDTPHPDAHTAAGTATKLAALEQQMAALTSALGSIQASLQAIEKKG